MTLNSKFALKSVSGLATDVLASPALGQNCSRQFAGEGASNESGVAENSDFRFIRSLSSEHFTYVATPQLLGDTTIMTLGKFQGHWTVSHRISQKTVCDTAKVTIDN